jgi:hypothetical protein
VISVPITISLELAESPRTLPTKALWEYYLDFAGGYWSLGKALFDNFYELHTEYIQMSVRNIQPTSKHLLWIFLK